MCAASIRFFRWRAGLVMQAMQREEFAEELAECVLELLDLNQEALAREVWTLGVWTRARAICFTAGRRGLTCAWRFTGGRPPGGCFLQLTA